jgi:1-acyl-sn-glycerol-3-phosphate acyltransferase
MALIERIRRGHAGPLVYFLLRRITWILSKFLIYHEVVGAENIPRSGPALLIVNHIDNVDIPLLLISTRRHIFFMAKQELFDVFVFGGLMRMAGTISVNRKAVDRQALREALDVLKKGGILGLFPEGHRNPAGVLQRAHTGATLLAQRSGVPIVPIALTGTERLFEEKGRFLPRRVAVKVQIGPPFHLPERNRGDREDLTSLTDYMMARLAALLPEERRGPYGEQGAHSEAGSGATAGAKEER